MICSCLAVSRSWFLVSRWVRTTATNEKRETRNVLHFLPFLLTIHLSVRLLLRDVDGGIADLRKNIHRHAPDRENGAQGYGDQCHHYGERSAQDRKSTRL